MSQIKLSSRTTESNVSLELAVSAILDYSAEEITAALKQASAENIAKLAIAVGKVWEEEEKE